ncbi:MAG: LysE family translocator [Rhizobiales bacterium]|nr:LysE family translocator [Hyphomicrobiales bacterium]MBO6697367.1 LysE family translocator [Hyphomicrobiales bacterium]MBO6736378.1 LysE family translocator [Hyphomicrobiales bacterium]MBO6912848.1 LysE family translocator [Hyphomicrobiales bacterium]MBO6954016.1 LysE family translocator [Hyphomicrobiales bacterium]
MLTATLSFLLAALALTGSPGPNTLSMAAVGASFGRLRGLEYMAGLNLGMVAVIALVGTGFAGIVLAVPGIAPVVTALAAAYFLYLAYRIATAPPLNQPAEDNTKVNEETAPRWYEGFGLSLVNPKAYAAMAALFSGHVLVEGSQLTDSLWKAGLLILTICVVNTAWLFAGAAMTSALQNPRTSRIVNIAFAILLLLSVAYATLS